MGAGILIGVGLGAVLVGAAYAISYAVANAEMDIDAMFCGDCWNCPPEGVEIGGQQKPGGEAGGRPATDNQGMSRTHSDGGF